MLVCKCPPEQHVGGKERQALADARLVSADRIGRMMVQVRSFRSAAHEGDHKDTRGRSQGHMRHVPECTCRERRATSKCEAGPRREA